jgi:hypothetical protein
MGHNITRMVKMCVVQLSYHEESKYWVTNVAKRFLPENFEECNIRVGIVFQRNFHLGDRTQVWTTNLACKKDKIWRRTRAGKSLSLSSSSHLPLFKLGGIIISSAVLLDIIILTTVTYASIKMKTIWKQFQQYNGMQIWETTVIKSTENL